MSQSQIRLRDQNWREHKSQKIAGNIIKTLKFESVIFLEGGNPFRGEGHPSPAPGNEFVGAGHLPSRQLIFRGGSPGNGFPGPPL